jgi:hypothetical protein
MHELPVAQRKDVNIIGYAGMTRDGRILMRLRSKGDPRGVVYYAPGDDRYAQIFAHLGGISPGQTEPVTPFVS